MAGELDDDEDENNNQNFRISFVGQNRFEGM